MAEKAVVLGDRTKLAFFLFSDKFSLVLSGLEMG